VPERTIHGMTDNDSFIGREKTGARRPPRRLRRWMQVVGGFYLLQFVMMAIVRAPIRTLGPKGALDLADAGDPVASFLVDTWTTFGLEVASVGVMVLVASRRAELARGVVLTVLAIEVGRGLVLDSYMIARGIHVAGYAVWIAIHSLVIVTGLWALRAGRAAESVAVATTAAMPAARGA
jgi:hypothetical protein